MPGAEKGDQLSATNPGQFNPAVKNAGGYTDPNPQLQRKRRKPFCLTGSRLYWTWVDSNYHPLAAQALANAIKSRQNAVIITGRKHELPPFPANQAGICRDLSTQ